MLHLQARAFHLRHVAASPLVKAPVAACYRLPNSLRQQLLDQQQRPQHGDAATPAPGVNRKPIKRLLVANRGQCIHRLGLYESCWSIRGDDDHNVSLC